MKGGPGAKFVRPLLRKRHARGLFAAAGLKGFTVVEVLIVLAVTGALFISAVLLVSGRQRQTEFNQAIREVQSQIQQVINEVAIGYYPNNGNFSCSASGGGPVITAAAAGQGTNTGCIFIGKAIQFDVSGTDPEEFRVMTIAGLQQNSAGQEVSTYTEALPKAVAPTTSEPSLPDVSSSEQLLYGLSTQRMSYGTGSGTTVGVVAFVNSLAQFSGGSVVSGAQQVSAVPINSTSLNSAPNAAAQSTNTYLRSLGASPPSIGEGVKICFVSGGTDQSGLITIGGEGRQLSVTLSIKSNTTCS